MGPGCQWVQGRDPAVADGQAGRSGRKAEDVVRREDDVHQSRFYFFHRHGVTIDGDRRRGLRVRLLRAGPQLGFGGSYLPQETAATSSVAVMVPRRERSLVGAI